MMNALRNVIMLICLIACVSLTASLWAQPKQTSLPVIPRPQVINSLPGNFTVNASTTIQMDAGNSELRRLATTLTEKLKVLSGHTIKVVENKSSSPASNIIILTLKDAPDSLEEEGYLLSVRKERIVLKAKAAAGIFYGLCTIDQLLIEHTGNKKSTVVIPAADIADKPRFAWRGMLLDVGRYFYPVEDVKRMIDHMAMYKMNTFHWHLTEDQGWRIEIKKHPKLTEVSAWRDGTIIGHLNDQPRRYDGKRHGGFYTQDQVREIIAYARERYINVVPEIEMPGHSVAALASYPELSCTGGPFTVSQTWGVHEDVYCAGNEQTYTFLEDILTEVADLFPGRYIHIGGDECPKARWKVCPKCQAKIKKEGLKDEHELQSYLIRRMEKFLLTKNKTIVGWDEILEGGLAPNAMVMSWRGITGGIEAAKQHHGVIMTPRNPMYLDYYQSDPVLEPLTIGGMNVLRDAYAYDPVPAELTKEEAKYIAGAQANVWTEYIADLKRAEYMTMPRLAAIAEVVWTMPDKKDWEDFAQRMQQEYRRYEKKKINYSTSAYKVQQKITFDPGNNAATVTLLNDVYQTPIHYTLDGSEPGVKAKLYTGPFKIDRPVTIKAASFVNAKQQGNTTERHLVFNRAVGKKTEFTSGPDRRSPLGNKVLVDGLRGGPSMRDGGWVGYYTKPMSVVVDLETGEDVSKVTVSFLNKPQDNIVSPDTFTISVSTDGKTYTEVSAAPVNVSNTVSWRPEYSKTFPALKTRYVKVEAKHKASTWLYVDEIVIEK